MKGFSRKIGYTLAAAMLFSFCCGEALAEVTDASVATPTDISVTVADPMLTDSDDVLPALRSQWRMDGSEIYEQDFFSNHYLEGVYAACSEYFNVGRWDVQGAALTLEYSTSQLLRSDSSQITIKLNDRPVYSGHIPSTNGERRSATFSLPVDAILANNVNHVSIEGYLRANDTEACADDASSAAWLNVFDESFVNVAFTSNNSCAVISDFYDCFTSIEALGNEKSAIIVSDDPSEDALSTAAIAAAGISSGAALFNENIGFRRATAGSSFNTLDHAIYICEYEKLLPQISALLSDKQREMAQSYAVATLVKYNSCNVLVVTAENTKALLSAGTMIANKEYMRMLSIATKQIEAKEDFRMAEYSAEQYVALTASGTYVHGHFLQAATFDISYPDNRTLARSSELSLDFRYSDNIDFERSMITVFINDKPIGSKRLDVEKAEGDSLRLDIPDDINVTGSFTVRVEFYLHAGDEWCDLTPDEIPWGYVAQTSMLKLAFIDDSERVFENYPSPFVWDGSFNELCIILPQEPSDIDLKILNKLMLTIGKYLKDNTGDLKVYKGAPSADELTNASIIAIGSAERNYATLNVPEALNLRYNADHSSLISSNSFSIDSSLSQKLGCLQLVRSPYGGDKENSMLVISGVNEDSMLEASAQLTTAELLWSIEGDTILADEDNAFCYYLIEEQEAHEAPVERAQDSGESVAAISIISASVIVLCLLSLVLIIAKYRRKKGDK